MQPLAGVESSIIDDVDTPVHVKHLDGLPDPKGRLSEILRPREITQTNHQAPYMRKFQLVKHFRQLIRWCKIKHAKLFMSMATITQY